MIIATFDVTGAWTFAGDPTLDLGIRFADGHADRIYLDGLKFGWQVLVNGEESANLSWPPSHIVIRELTPSRTFPYRLDAAPDDDITLLLWATNRGVRVEDEITFTVPRPAQTFPSWTWVDGAWTPPVAYPDGDGMYEWDEDAGDWTAVESSDG